MPKPSRVEILKERLPKAVSDLTGELQRVMQLVSDKADISVNLNKECSLVHDMYKHFERTVSGLASLDILISEDSDLTELYEDVIVAQKDYSELEKTLKAISELKTINSVVATVGDDLATHKSDLNKRCLNIISVIRGDHIPLPDKIVNDLTELMGKLAKAKVEPVTPMTAGASAENLFLPPSQPFAAGSMFSMPGYMNRIDEKLLPSFDGQETSYASFKDNFQKLTATQDKSYLQMLLASERVVKDKALRLQLQQISTHDAQWTYLDQLFKSRTRQILCIYNQWDKKPKLSDSKQIIAALAEFSGAVTQLEQLTQDSEEVTTSQWLTVLLLEMFSKKLPKEFQDKLNWALGSMDKPDVPKLLEIMEQQRGAMIMRSTYDSDSPYKKKGPAAAATAVGKFGSPSKHKKGDQSCPSDGCDAKHMLYKCAKFISMSVPDRKGFIKKVGACNLCLNRGHRAAECPRAERLGNCRIDGCDQAHNGMLHETVGNGQAAAVYEAPFLPADNFMMMLQKVDVLDIYKNKVPVSAMWDSGANLTMVTKNIAKQLQLPSTGRTATISLADGKTQSCPTVKLCLVDRNKNLHLLECAVVPAIGHTDGLKSMDPDKAAAVFDMRPEDFSLVNGPVEVLLGHVSPVTFPAADKLVGQSRLYRSLFGTGFFAVSADGESSVKPVVCKATKLEVRSMDFLDTESLGIQPPPMCNGCKGCRHCAALAAGKSILEERKQQLIEEGLTLDLMKGEWTAAYPYRLPPSTLPDNSQQAYKIALRDRQRMVKKGEYSAFVSVFKEAIERGVYQKASPQDLEYDGPVYYASLVNAYKDSISTPLRICANSSLCCQGTSLNNILMEGPQPLYTLFHNLLRFRGYRCACCADISKFYNSLAATVEDSHLKRVWFSETEDGELEIYLTKRINFGEKLAGDCAVTALRLTGRIYGGRSRQHVQDIYGLESVKGCDVVANTELWRESQQPAGSRFVLYQEPSPVKLEKNTYIDDHLSGHNSKPEAVQMIEELSEIIKHGNFKFKSTIFSGDNVDPVKILGILWDPKEDKLFLPVRANHGPKIKGRKIEEDLDLENLWRALPDSVTKRELWRIVMQLYDPLGLATPLLLKSKLCLREVCISGVDWDQPVPGTLREDFVVSLQDRAALGDISFERSLVPDKPLGLPTIIGFCDASNVAYAAICYLRWPTETGTQVILCCAKSRVAPLKIESIPRLEMLSCLVLARLIDSVSKALPFELAGKLLLSDSTCALSQLCSESVLLNTFNSHRCSEIQQLTKPEQWRWVPTNENIADLATRGTCTVEDVLPSSKYQQGPAWLRLDESMWPTRMAGAVKTKIPDSEMNPKMLKLRCMAVQTVDTDFFRVLARRTYRQARRTMQAVLKAANLFKMLLIKKRGVARPVEPAGDANSSKYFEDHIFSNTYLQNVCDYFLVSLNQGEEFLSDAKGQFDSLQPYVEETELYWPVIGQDGCYPLRKFRILKMSARGEESLQFIAGAPKKLFRDSPGLVLLNRHNKLVRLILQQSHDELGHAGHRKTLVHSRRYAWIVYGRQEAVKVVRNCAQCSLEYAKRSSPTIANILPDRTEPSTPFQHTHIDLAGPLECVRPGARTRKNPAKFKVWLLIACCRFSQAIFIDVLLDCSTEAVLVAMRKLQAVYNMPKVVTTDRGTNFVGAKRVLDELLKNTSMHFEWNLVPTGAHSFVGTVERQVALVKRILNRKLSGAAITHNNLLLLTAEVARTLNNKPLSYATQGDDVDTWRIISPSDLLGGRTNDGICTFETGSSDKITRRLEQLEELTRQFHNVYREQILPEMVRAVKWKSGKNLLCEGDIVIVDDSTNLVKKHRLGRIQQLREGGRTAVVRFKLSDESRATDNEISTRRLLKVDLSQEN